jgi:hypothetical protein
VNCYDCAVPGLTSPAVAVCRDCGAAVCADHAHPVTRHLTRTLVINRIVPIEPAARAIYCGPCYTAHRARGDVPAASTARVTRSGRA